jgi:hypothetical protein
MKALFEDAIYADLQREIHDALLAQHLDWILPNGDSPTCDSYDARFAELLTQLPQTRSRSVKQDNAHQFQYQSVTFYVVERLATRRKSITVEKAPPPPAAQPITSPRRSYDMFARTCRVKR